MADWLPIAGTLLGAIVGSTSTLLAQRLAFKRDRTAKMTDLRREAITCFLSESHKHYRELFALHQENSDASSRETANKRVSPVEAQVALDNVRFLIAGEPTEKAERLWLHLRQAAFARGDAKFRNEWRREYWRNRKVLVSSVRILLGS